MNGTPLVLILEDLLPQATRAAEDLHGMEIHCPGGKLLRTIGLDDVAIHWVNTLTAYQSAFEVLAGTSARLLVADMVYADDADPSGELNNQLIREAQTQAASRNYDIPDRLSPSLIPGWVLLSHYATTGTGRRVLAATNLREDLVEFMPLLFSPGDYEVTGHLKNDKVRKEIIPKQLRETLCGLTLDDVLDELRGSFTRKSPRRFTHGIDDPTRPNNRADFLEWAARTFPDLDHKGDPEGAYSATAGLEESRNETIGSLALIVLLFLRQMGQRAPERLRIDDDHGKAGVHGPAEFVTGAAHKRARLACFLSLLSELYKKGKEEKGIRAVALCNKGLHVTFASYSKVAIMDIQKKFSQLTHDLGSWYPDAIREQRKDPYDWLFEQLAARPQGTPLDEELLRQVLNRNEFKRLVHGRDRNRGITSRLLTLQILTGLTVHFPEALSDDHLVRTGLNLYSDGRDLQLVVKP